MPSRPERIVRLAVDDVTVVVDLDEGARAQFVDGRRATSCSGSTATIPCSTACTRWRRGPDGCAATRCSGTVRSTPCQSRTTPWALHGTALAQPATVLEIDAGPDREARLVARIEEHPGWPWPMAVDIEWHLRARELTTTITVHALADPFPGSRGLASVVPSPARLRGTAAAVDASDPSGSCVATTTCRRARWCPTTRLDGPFDDAFRVPDGTRHSLPGPGHSRSTSRRTATGTWCSTSCRPSCAWSRRADRPTACALATADELGGPAIASPGSPHVLTTTWTMRDLAR